MIIGVVGPIASGKSMLSDALVKRGFIKLSFSAEVREEAAKKNILIRRKELQDLGNEMRLKEGKDYWAKRIIAKMREGENYVVEGIRNLSEVESLRKLNNFILVAVDAPIEKRYQWIMIRGKDSDPSSLEDVKKIDARDRGEGEEAHGQQSAKCVEMADYHLSNDKTKENFEKKVIKFLKKLKV
ncbi:AAA family ATPase [Candidatus Pacearchaeota archaeon]|nr:AAA family ATPase [Candidatus Pacearchaeota archaeon]